MLNFGCSKYSLWWLFKKVFAKQLWFQSFEVKIAIVYMSLKYKEYSMAGEFIHFYTKLRPVESKIRTSDPQHDF